MRSNIKNRGVLLMCFLALVQFVCSGQSIILRRGYYTSWYDTQLLCPKQVTWTLHRSDLGDVRREPSWRFASDINAAGCVATHDDYKNSGYDRGHLCPAADRSFMIGAMRQTFSTANIAPQVPALNRGAWLATERWCRDAAVLFDSVCVLAVPLWLDRDTIRIGVHGIAVPHAFFKVAYIPATDSVLNCWFYFNK